MDENYWKALLYVVKINFHISVNLRANAMGIDNRSCAIPKINNRFYRTTNNKTLPLFRLK